MPADGTPIVLGGGNHPAQGGRGDFEIRELFDGFADHVLEGLGFDVRKAVVGTFDFEAERSREVFFVTDHYVHVLGDLAVDLLGFLEAADGLPERRAIIQIVRNDGAMLLGGFHGLDGHLGRRLGEGREDASRVEPADAQRTEEVFPVEVTGLNLRGGGVAAVWDADSATDAEAPFGEVEAVADRSADAIIFTPFDIIGIHAALHDEIFE